MENQQQPKSELIPSSTAAKILTLSAERVAEMCRNGELKTAIKPGGERGNWRVDRNEVIARIQKR